MFGVLVRIYEKKHKVKSLEGVSLNRLHILQFFLCRSMEQCMSLLFYLGETQLRIQNFRADGTRHFGEYAYSTISPRDFNGL